MTRMSDSDLRAIALFFFFSTLDDNFALNCASEAHSICVKKLQKNPHLNPRITLVAACLECWNKYKNKITRGKPQYSNDSGWMLPKNLNLSSWNEFQKKATEEELLALITSKILNISDEEISIGMGVSIGTLRFRVARGLKKLAACLNHGLSPVSLVR